MAITKVLNWPATQTSYGHKVKLSPEGQYSVACDRASRVLDHLKERHPGEKITVAFAFAGFIPHG